MAASGTQSGMTFQSLQINGTQLLRRHSPAPATATECACSVAVTCPNTMPSKGQFLCHYGNNCTAGAVVWTTPGIVSSCANFDTALASDLRCFFNRTCVDILLSLFNIDMPTRLPLPAAILAIPVLNSFAPSAFLPNDTVESLIARGVVEELEVRSNFVKYFDACAPATCTYKITRRIDYIYIVAIFASLFGGLVVVIRLFVPVGVQLVAWIIRRWRNPPQAGDMQQGMWHRFALVSVRLKNRLIVANAFRKESATSRMPNVENLAVVSTRFYFVLLIGSMFVFGVFSGLSLVTVAYTVVSPSLATFELLQEAYTTALVCPCQHIAIPHGTYLSLVPVFHQVCSSAFINSTWTTLLYGYGPSANSYLQLDRPLLSKHLQILKWLCEEITATVAYQLSIFLSAITVRSSTISRNNFEVEVADMSAQFAKRVPIDFWRELKFYTLMFKSSFLPTAFNNDWLLEYGNSTNTFLMRSIPRTFTNTTCNCAVSDTCQQPLRIGPSNLVLPGLVIGCTPIDGLRMSTLECFFSSDCIDTIIRFLDYYTQMDQSSPLNFVPPPVSPIVMTPLDNNTRSRFSKTTLIEILIGEIFIEHWTRTSSYESYFAACAPTVCRYEQVHRNNPLETITSLIGFYGGLTVGLRFLTWNTIRLYRRVRYRLHTRRIIVQAY